MIAAALSIAAAASPARAVTLGELAEQVNRAVSGGLPEDQEQALFGGLGVVSGEVADRYDAWVRSGTAEARTAAASLADGLLPLLERLYQYHQGKIDRAQNEIIAQDGNPEVLYDQKWWQLDRGFSLAAAGQLAWLHYRVAMLHPEAKEKRDAWLRKSVKEFSEFVYAKDPKLSGESLLGRAMAEGEVGERDQALGDLEAIFERGRESPLYWPARLAAAQVKSKAGTADALAETQKLLADASSAGLPSDTLNQIRLLRLEALAASVDKSGAMSEPARREAVALSNQLSQLGAVWSRRVYEIALAHMKDPRQLVGNTASAEWIAAENLASADKFQEAIPAYQAVLRSAEQGSREHAAEAHHRLGICYFRLGRYVDAEREFRAFLNAAPQSPLAGEAAYLQFRSAEGMYREHPSVETRGMFTAAVENYVQNHPKHENFYEGAFRYGEILQGERRFQEAADEFAQVKGPPAFESRAASLEVQCLADLLSNPPKDADQKWADPLRARAAKAYERFEKAAASDKSGATSELRARTTLALAMTETGGPSPRYADSLATLKDFEKKYPQATDMHLLAGALRLAAASGLRRYDDAAHGVDVLPASHDAGFADLLEKIARSFLRTSADAAVSDPAAGQKWAALAAKVFDRLKAEGRPIASDVKWNLAQIYAEQGRFADATALYRDLVRESPKSKTILRGAAMVADRSGAAAEAADYWARLAMLEEVATPAWYEARVATANDLIAAGQLDKACKNVEEVDGFRPDLRDEPTRQRFRDIAAKACKTANR